MTRIVRVRNVPTSKIDQQRRNRPRWGGDLRSGKHGAGHRSLLCRLIRCIGVLLLIALHTL